MAAFCPILLKFFSLQSATNACIIGLKSTARGGKTVNEVRDIQPTNVHIKVQNFGPIEKAEIDLRPLTVFVGESNTGKTYLAALIYALYGSFAGFARFPWSHHDVLDLRLTMRDSQVYAKDEEIREILEKLWKGELPYRFSDLSQETRVQLQSSLNTSEIFSSQLKRCFDLGSTSDLIRFTSSPDNEMKVSLEVRERNQTFWSVAARDSGLGITVKGTVNENLIICSEEIDLSKAMLGIEDFESYLRQYIWNGKKVCYLPAARSGLMQSHSVIAASLIEHVTRTGLEHLPEVRAFSGMIADFLKLIILYNKENGASDEVIHVAKALEHEVLCGEIEVNRSVPNGYPEFLYRPWEAKRALQMSHSSSMVSELAPLVLFLRGIVQPGDLLIIEEPEAHLHPAAQTRIAHTLARLVRTGVRVVITTHSDWLLQQIGNLIRQGELKKLRKNKAESESWLTKEEVGAWWFHSEKPVAEIPFDRIEGIEPSDYEAVADRLYNTFVELERQFLKEEAADQNE